ncbi:MAG: response regulator [Planctomycetota bacterium]|jgi:PAS domain S-box-containing protein
MAATLWILHLEHDAADARLIRETLVAHGVACETERVWTAAQYRERVARGGFDAILADPSDPSFGAFEPLDLALRHCPHTPFIVVSEMLGEERVIEYLKRGAADCVLKENLARLGPSVRRAVAQARKSRRRREDEECLREFTEHIHGFFWMIEPDGSRLLYASPAYERIWGRSLDSLRARPRERLEAILPEDRRRVEAAVAALGRGGTFDEEYRIERPDGSIRWIWDRGRSVPEGEARFLVGIAEDITRRKELEAQLVRSQKLESLGRLAGGVAHDLNNQLSVILGSAELAAEANLDDTIHQDLEMVLTAAGNAATLTAQLLAFSRRQVLHPAVTDLNETVRAARNVLGRVLGEDIELVLKPDACPGTVKVDPVQLEQVIINLAINARDAMPRGGRLMIETANLDLDEPRSCEREMKPGPYVLLAVTDTGTGMDPTTLAQVFEPFFTTKDVGEGTGLGLSVVHGIVRQSGGYICAHSQLGEGSTFEVFLPLVEEEPTPGAPAPRRSTTRGFETILLVEDDLLVLELVRRILERRGYRVFATASPAEALDICRQVESDIHLLITDVVMPQMSGRQLAREVAGLRPGIRVLYMSGHAPQALANHGMTEADPLLMEKPLVPDKLHEKIRQALRDTPPSPDGDQGATT